MSYGSIISPNVSVIIRSTSWRLQVGPINVINHIYRIFKRVRIFHLPHEFPRITLAASPFLLVLVLHDTPYAPPPQTEHFRRRRNFTTPHVVSSSGKSENFLKRTPGASRPNGPPTAPRAGGGAGTSRAGSGRNKLRSSRKGRAPARCLYTAKLFGIIRTSALIRSGDETTSWRRVQRSP